MHPHGMKPARPEELLAVAKPSDPWSSGSMLPITAPAGPEQPSPPRGSPINSVELQVANLDQSIDQKEMRKTITSMFKEHVQLVQVSVFYQSDGSMVACVKVSSIQDAQIAISRLHRKKLGSKRIILSYSNQNKNQNATVLRSKVVALLMEVPSRKLPLFKFREMFEKRHHGSVGVSDLYRMKDILTVLEEDSGRMVYLHSNPPSDIPSLLSPRLPLHSSQMDPNYCSIHSPGDISKGWAEKESDCHLPNVSILLSDLSENLKTILYSHGGSVPLASLVHCYNADIVPQLTPDTEKGVPLEHLLSCLKGFLIHSGPSGVKKLSLLCGESEMSKSHNSGGSFNPCPSPLMGQLSVFTRELVDLLRCFPGSIIAFSKFIPAYHHHFGRQCRVADYGYTRLRDVFEAIPNAVQILGEGSKCFLTLSHRSQIKRLASDIIRLLKTQSSKSLRLRELETLFESELGVPFNIQDYGVCNLEDIIFDVPENSIGFTNRDCFSETTLFIHQREQTREEAERTLVFSKEVVELLKHAPNCSLPFTKFIPAYHHHFSRQCRVADYGFGKLIDLLEAIPSTVNLHENMEAERIISLVEEEMMNVIGEQLTSVLKYSQGLSVDALAMAYLNSYGYPLRPENVGASSLKDLLKRFIGGVIEIHDLEDENAIVFLSETTLRKMQCTQVKELLADKKNERVPLDQFLRDFKERYNIALNLEQIMPELQDWLEFSNGREGSTLIALKPVKVALLNIQSLLKENAGRIRLSELEETYQQRFNVEIDPQACGYSNLSSLLSSFSNESINVRGRRPRKMLILSGDLLSTSCIGNPSARATTTLRRPPRPPCHSTPRAKRPTDCNNGSPPIGYDWGIRRTMRAPPITSQPPPPLLLPSPLMGSIQTTPPPLAHTNKALWVATPEILPRGGQQPLEKTLSSVGESPTCTSYITDEESTPFVNKCFPEPRRFVGGPLREPILTPKRETSLPPTKEEEEEPFLEADSLAAMLPTSLATEVMGDFAVPSPTFTFPGETPPSGFESNSSSSTTSSISAYDTSALNYIFEGINATGSVFSESRQQQHPTVKEGGEEKKEIRRGMTFDHQSSYI